MAEIGEKGKRRREDNLLRYGKDKKAPTTEEAKKNGRLGGIASGKARHEKMTMQKALGLIEELPVQGKTKNMLKALGVPEEQQIGCVAMAATMYSMIMKGDRVIIEKYLDYLLKHEENDRKFAESKARIEALVNGEVSVESTDDDEGRVQIYLPAIESEESHKVNTVNGGE